MPATALRLVFLVALVLLCAGCGGGGNGDSTVDTEDGVAAFPDVLEIARAEFPDNAPMLDVRVSEDTISILHVQFGRSTRFSYNPKGIFTGRKRSTKPVDPSRTFSIGEVPANAPARIRTAIEAREGSDALGFSATLARRKDGSLTWDVRATVDGEAKKYSATRVGTLKAT